MTKLGRRVVQNVRDVRLVVDDQDADLVVGHGLMILHSRREIRGFVVVAVTPS